MPLRQPGHAQALADETALDQSRQQIDELPVRRSAKLSGNCSLARRIDTARPISHSAVRQRCGGAAGVVKVSNFRDFVGTTQPDPQPAFIALPAKLQ